MNLSNAIHRIATAEPRRPWPWWLILSVAGGLAVAVLIGLNAQHLPYTAYLEGLARR